MLITQFISFGNVSSLRLVRRGGVVVLGCAVACALGLASMLLCWHLQHKQVLGVQTASMRPLIMPGDAVLVTPRKAAHSPLRVGDVVAYHSLRDSSVVVTHRIVAIDSRTGWLTTKGDALSTNDPTIPPRLVIGSVTTVAPRLGTTLHYARQPVALALAVYAPALWIIVGECNRLYEHFAQRVYVLYGVRPRPFGGRRATSAKL